MSYGYPVEPDFSERSDDLSRRADSEDERWYSSTPGQDHPSALAPEHGVALSVLWWIESEDRDVTPRPI